MRSRTRQALRQPVRAAFHIASPVLAPILWRRHIRLAQWQGLGSPTLLLSFDCETERDTEAVEAVADRCQGQGLPLAIAVPGEIANHAPRVYARLARDGVEFINHGYRQHTVISDPSLGTTTNSLEYADLSPAGVLEDMRRGDQVLRSVTGRSPVGFRTPHFGSYQRPSQLRLIHSETARLGYLFSSSAIPLYGFRNGPAPAVEGGRLIELPVSGSFTRPHRVLDSWSFTAALDRSVGASDFERELERLGAYLREAGTGLINIYADPSHVVGWEGFFTVLRSMRDLALPFSEFASKRLRYEERRRSWQKD